MYSSRTALLSAKASAKDFPSKYSGLSRFRSSQSVGNTSICETRLSTIFPLEAASGTFIINDTPIPVSVRLHLLNGTASP